MSEEGLFNDAVRGAYYDGTWLRVVYEGVNGSCLMINPETGQCRGGFLLLNMSYSKFKSRVIKELKRRKNEQRKRSAIIEKNAPVINEIANIRSSTLR